MIIYHLKIFASVIRVKVVQVFQVIAW